MPKYCTMKNCKFKYLWYGGIQNDGSLYGNFVRWTVVALKFSAVRMLQAEKQFGESYYCILFMKKKSYSFSSFLFTGKKHDATMRSKSLPSLEIFFYCVSWIIGIIYSTYQVYLTGNSKFLNLIDGNFGIIKFSSKSYRTSESLCQRFAGWLVFYIS